MLIFRDRQIDRQRYFFRVIVSRYKQTYKHHIDIIFNIDPHHRFHHHCAPFTSLVEPFYWFQNLLHHHHHPLPTHPYHHHHAPHHNHYHRCRALFTSLVEA